MNKNTLQSATAKGAADKEKAKQESEYRSLEYKKGL
jgi:hypothetical protein